MSNNNQALNVVTYNGSLTTGVPVVLNPQLDRNGMVADYILIAATGTTPVSFRYTAGPLEGTVFVLIQGALFEFPGPLTTCELSGLTGTGYYVIMSQGVGKLPSIQMVSSGGGGGGGGTTNVEVLYGGPQDPNAPNGIQIANLQSDQVFNRDEHTSSPNHVSYPVSFAADFGLGTVVPTGGIGQQFTVKDAGGTKIYGVFEWQLNATSNLTELVFKGYQGAEYARMKMPLGSQRNGLHFDNSSGHPRAVTSDTDLYIQPIGELYLSAQSTDVVQITSAGVYLLPTTALIKGSQNLQVQANAGGTLALLNSIATGGVEITDTQTVIACGGMTWTLDAAGDITGPGGLAGEIKVLLDGSTPQSAATVNQVTNAVSGLAPLDSVGVGSIVYGATSTGTVAEATFLKVGGCYGAGDFVYGRANDWVAVSPGVLQQGRLACDDAPIVAGLDTFQLFEVYKNGSATGVTCQLTGSTRDVVELQVGPTVTAGDNYSYSIKAVLYGPYTVGLSDTAQDVAVALAGLSVANTYYTITTPGAGLMHFVATVAGASGAYAITSYVTGSSDFSYAHPVVGSDGSLTGIITGTPFSYMSDDRIALLATNQGNAGDTGATGVIANLAYTNS